MAREHDPTKEVKKERAVVAYEDLTDQGGAYGTVDLDTFEGASQLPDGAFVLGSRGRVLQAFDGTNPDVTVGTSSNVNRFQKASEVGVGSTGEVDLGVPNGQNAIEGPTSIQVRIGEDTDFANITQGQILIEVLYVS